MSSCESSARSTSSANVIAYLFRVRHGVLSAFSARTVAVSLSRTRIPYLILQGIDLMVNITRARFEVGFLSV
jgi:hypothetical protein